MSPKEIKESVTNIYMSSQKVYNLILNLFEWTRIQTGRFDTDQTKIDISENIE